MNNRHFGDNGLGIDDWHKGNGLLGEKGRNIGLRINDWHVGNGLLGDRQVRDGGFKNWQNCRRAL